MTESYRMIGSVKIPETREEADALAARGVELRARFTPGAPLPAAALTELTESEMALATGERMGEY